MKTIDLVIHRNVIKTFIAALVLLAAMLGGCGAPAQQETTATESEVHDEEVFVELSDSERDEFGIAVDTARAGALSTQLSLPGEVKVNQDRFAHIVPRISGVVHAVEVSAGDAVRAGDVLAVLDSRELADIKSEYLAGIERLSIAEAAHSREEGLFAKKISSEQEFLEARQKMAEARIALRSSRQKLLALGFEEPYIDALPEQPEHALVHYAITAPISGTVTEKHISRGEALSAEAEAFAIADLRTVWVDLNVFQKDLDLVAEGQKVDVVTANGKLRATGEISYVRPIVGEETRTAIARIVLENTDGRWKPGLFVSGMVAIDEVVVPVLVPKSALIAMEGSVVVFVQEAEGFAPRAVTVGRESETHSEVTSGLEAGEVYVSSGGFALKAELGKDELGEGHGH